MYLHLKHHREEHTNYSRVPNKHTGIPLLDAVFDHLHSSRSQNQKMKLILSDEYSFTPDTQMILEWPNLLSKYYLKTDCANSCLTSLPLPAPSFIPRLSLTLALLIILHRHPRVLIKAALQGTNLSQTTTKSGPSSGLGHSWHTSSRKIYPFNLVLTVWSIILTAVKD